MNSAKKRKRRNRREQQGASNLWAFAEVAVGAAIALLLLALGKSDLANIAWILGLLLNLGRVALLRGLKESVSRVDKMAEIVDLQQECSVASIQQILRLYVQISEPQFRLIKDAIISEAGESLLRLANEKTSGELPTGDYYNFLLPMIERSEPGSQIWAVSMMLESEWNDSPPERRFLKANTEAAERGVQIDRIFVIPEAHIAPALSANIGIRSHLERGGDNLRGSVVKREYLEQHDSLLLKELGDGLIAFDESVALIDSSSEGEIRGKATMNPSELRRLRRLFDNLKVHSVDLPTLEKEIEKGTPPPKAV